MCKTTLKTSKKEKLTKYLKENPRNIIVAIDTSGSTGITESNGQSRLENLKKPLLEIAKLSAKLDEDGIGIILWNHTMTFKDNVKDEIIIEKIIMDANPGGTTHATPVLNKSYELYKKYEEDNESQKTLLLVFTDGEFSDGAKAEKKIVEIRKNMQENNADTDDFKIVFLQFGDDRSATKYLQHLDDDLCHQNYDIVDVKTVHYISQRIKQGDSYGDMIIDCITENND